MATSGHSQEKNFNPLISSVADSPASPLASQGNEGEQKMNDGFGLSLQDYFAWYDPDTHSLRMSQVSWVLGECPIFSETWPDFGTMQSGLLFQRQPWVPRILGGVFSLLPTLVASERMNDPTAVPSQRTLDKFSRGEIKRV